MGLPERINLLGLAVDPWTMEQTLEATRQFIDSQKFAHVVGVNADKVLQTRDDENMRQIVKNCEIVSVDGASLLLASKILKNPVPERVAGIDYMQQLCALGASEGWTVFLLGAQAQIVEKAAGNLKQTYENLQISGYQHGYFQKSEWESIAQRIANLQPKIVFIGITSPIKEHLIEFFRTRGLSSVFVGVGGSFDVISGDIARAPLFMQKIHLEWFFRMVQEPRRLMKRYFVGNFKFLRLLISAKIRYRKTQ